MEGPNANRQPWMHPRHPGIGCTTTLMPAEGDEPEVGGYFLFLPSGKTVSTAWRQPKPIQPTLDAAKDFVASNVDFLQKGGFESDLRETNWTSVTAAVQRIILDFNSRVSALIGAKMAEEFGDNRGLAPKNVRIH